eukprot:2629951-Pleurochrysis_carterae.AAC.1
MSAVDVLGALMMLRVVGKVDGRLVVERQGCRFGARVAQVGEECSKVHGLLGGLACGYYLGFAREKRDGRLLLG